MSGPPKFVNPPPPLPLPMGGGTPPPPIRKRRIPSSKGELVRTPGSTNRHTRSALMAQTPVIYAQKLFHRRRGVWLAVRASPTHREDPGTPLLYARCLHQAKDFCAAAMPPPPQSST